MEAQNSRLRMGEADCAKVTDKLKKREIEVLLLCFDLWRFLGFDWRQKQYFNRFTQFTCRSPSRNHGENVTAALQKH